MRFSYKLSVEYETVFFRKEMLLRISIAICIPYLVIAVMNRLACPTRLIKLLILVRNFFRDRLRTKIDFTHQIKIQGSKFWEFMTQYITYILCSRVLKIFPQKWDYGSLLKLLFECIFFHFEIITIRDKFSFWFRNIFFFLFIYLFFNLNLFILIGG